MCSQSDYACVRQYPVACHSHEMMTDLSSPLPRVFERIRKIILTSFLSRSSPFTVYLSGAGVRSFVLGCYIVKCTAHHMHVHVLYMYVFS